MANGSRNGRLERTLALLFRPLAKLMIANDMPLLQAVELFKRALVDEVDASPLTTDSHINLKTGVHRKDVKRLRSDQEMLAPKIMPASPIAAVLTLWSQDPAYCDTASGPRSLPRQRSATEPGFDDLVRAVKNDLAPATILSELLLQGLVATDADGCLKLLSDTYLPILGDAVLDAFDATVLDHLHVATANAINAPEVSKGFDRVVRYSHLSQSSVDQLNATSRAAAMCYLQDLNTLAHELQAADDASGANVSGRFVTGVFIAQHANATAQEAAAQEKDNRKP